MSNNRSDLSYRCPPNLLDNVSKQNHAIITIVGSHITRLKALNGYSDRYIASLAGCGNVTILAIRHGSIKYCGITLLTKIAAAMGENLLDWLNPAYTGKSSNSSKAALGLTI